MFLQSARPYIPKDDDIQTASSTPDMKKTPSIKRCKRADNALSSKGVGFAEWWNFRIKMVAIDGTARHGSEEERTLALCICLLD